MACRFLIALAIFPTISTGSRLKQISQDDLLRQSIGVGNSIQWKPGTSYFCLKKWEKRTREFQEKYCLASVDEVLKGIETGDAQVKVTKTLSRCNTQGQPHRFNVCNLKGKADKRLNYGKKRSVPKSCFVRMKHDFVAPSGMQIPLVVAAVRAKTCRRMFKLPPTSQGRLGMDDGSEGSEKKPALKPLKPVEPMKDLDWNNIPDPNNVEDGITTTTTTSDEDGVGEDDTTTTTTTTVVHDALQNLLDEDRDGIEESDGLDMEVLDELDTDVDSGVEDRFVQEDIEDVGAKSADLDLDALDVAQVRELWQKRATRAAQQANK